MAVLNVAQKKEHATETLFLDEGPECKDTILI